MTCIKRQYSLVVISTSRLPKNSLEAPKRFQDDPKTFQDCPGRPQEGPQKPPRLPKTPPGRLHDALKTTQNRQDAPRCSKDVPRRPKTSAKTRPDASRLRFWNDFGKILGRCSMVFGSFCRRTRLRKFTSRPAFGCIQDASKTSRGVPLNFTRRSRAFKAAPRLPITL